jgi:hypothetical protein
LSFNPLGRQVESSSNRDFEVWESCIFNIPFRGLVIGFLVIGHSVSEAFDLLTKSIFHLTVDGFVGPNGFEQSVTDRLQGDGVNVFPDSIEGHGDCVRGEQLGA